MESALKFRVIKKWNNARVSELTLPHFVCSTPMFMPVGTQGTVKALTTQQLEDLQCQVILGNTYHLGHRPGPDVIDNLGGLHNFMNWKRGILTDSGGFQMVSLLKLAEITEEGVKFQSPHNGTEMLLTPEESITIQNKIGADIMMALDDVVSSTTTGPRVEEAMYRILYSFILLNSKGTIRWIDRCIKAHKKPKVQNLFGIVQGGLDENLRRICLDELIKRDLPGYAIGGLSGGESKDKFWKIVHFCAPRLPENKPRYLMGVGYAVDLVVCSSLGVDMFDCVYPSRTARFGTALVPTGSLHLKSSEYERDYRPIDDNCKCMVCMKYTRAYLHSIANREHLSSQLITYHNIAYQMDLMKNIRNGILEDRFPQFVQEFMKLQFPEKDYPTWAKDALEAAGVSLL